MRIICLLALSLFFVCNLFGNGDSTFYVLEIDIKNIDNDRVSVSLEVPEISKDTVIYNMPKIIPGTYSISDFGRFVNDFKAMDSSGELLATQRLDTNRWMIFDARKLHSIAYSVDDSYDEPGGANIFEPAGTNIEAGENVVLNTFGFAGYLENAKDLPYEVRIIKPAQFYGETSLPRLSIGDTIDVYRGKDYFQVHDCPMLYCEPDTASMMVGDTRIAVAVYSPKGVVKSKEVLDQVDELFPAAAKYLGGDLPVDQYSILLYLTAMGSGSGGFGALEHNTSTVCVLPEVSVDALAQTIKDVVAHEFFHIVTPLNIHSEQIDNYDFVNPQMSRHLWLYEGCTEYAAQHVQVKYDLMSFDEFLQVIKQKMASASSFDSGVAFTELSKKALGEHEDQYLNVYQKGALIGMALDLKLLHLSKTEYSLQDLMRDLSAEYGVEKPFQDNLLFEEIARISGFPETEMFLEKHVGDTIPIPYDELLAYAGIEYAERKVVREVSGGGMAVGYNPRTDRMVIVSVEDLDDFGREMGFERGDELISWNGEEVTKDNMIEVLENYKKNTQAGDKVTVVVARRMEDRSYKEKKLKGKAIEVERVKTNILRPMSDPSQEQLRLREAWLSL